MNIESSECLSHVAKDSLSLSSVSLRGLLQEAELHLPLFFRLSKVLLVHVLKPCLVNSGTFMPLLVEQHVSNWWTTAVVDGVTSILMTSEEISAVQVLNGFERFFVELSL